ncbi:diguanylate cyclase [Nakamurella panacisegetis]|uniref:diguanylate cyclase n=1 Tax=Nakamurella panacisegetis TaxID=1090615 RepID=UPI00155F5482|nr:diguanylate cyclase [Nakamurella panacisegetis]
MDDLQQASLLDPFRSAVRLISGIHSHRELTDTVQAVVDAVVETVGFAVAVVSVVGPSGRMRTIAVAGSASARLELLGVERPLSTYQAEFDVADHWGSLRFVPWDRAPDAHALGWVPEVPVSPDVDAWHPMDALFAPLRSSDGELIGVLSVDLPVSGRRPAPPQRELLELLAVQAGIAVDNARLTERLRAGEEIFREAFDRTATGMALLHVREDKADQYLRVNPAFCRLLGYSVEELLQLDPAEVTHPDDKEEDAHLVSDLIAGRVDVYQRDKRYLHRMDEPVWVSVSATIARTAEGRPLCAVLQIEDISARRATLERLEHLARHDPLTDLPNRSVLTERLRQAATLAHRDGVVGSALFIDLDGFKRINDQHGHRMGDHVLVTVGQRIRATVREADVVGRWGGDEFVVVANDLDPIQAQVLAERIAAAVAEPITDLDISVSVRVSIGIGPIPIEGGDVAHILDQADHSMYKEKPKGERPTDGLR